MVVLCSVSSIILFFNSSLETRLCNTGINFHFQTSSASGKYSMINYGPACRAGKNFGAKVKKFNVQRLVFNAV